MFRFVKIHPYPESSEYSVEERRAEIDGRTVFRFSVFKNNYRFFGCDAETLPGCFKKITAAINSL